MSWLKMSSISNFTLSRMIEMEEMADALVHSVLKPMGIYIDDSSAIIIEDKELFFKALKEHITKLEES